MTGDRLDGVILADPFAEAALLQATGPVSIPGYDIEIDADNVVPFTTNEAFAVHRPRDSASGSSETWRGPPSNGS